MSLLNGTAASEKLEGGSADDQLFGLSGDDTLLGLAGADLLSGGGGDDFMDGGAGPDRGVFRGLLEDYRLIASGPSGLLSVWDLVSDRDGIDTLVGIEALEFGGIALDEGVWISDTSGREDGGPIGVRLTRLGDATASLAVGYAISWGADDPTALLPPARDPASTSDLATGHALTGSITFGPGQRSVQVLVTPANDTAGERGEWLTVGITSAVTGAGAPVPVLDGEAAVRIDDDDAAMLGFEEDALGLGTFFLGSEAEGRVQLWVLRAGRVESAVSVVYTVAMGAPGTAVLADLAPGQALTGTLAFAPGETRKSIDLAVLDDNLVEKLYEDFEVTLSNAQAADGTGALLAPAAVAYGSIADDDDGSIRVTASDTLLSDAEIGAGRLTLSAFFGDAMLADGTANPVFTFSPQLHGTLSLAGGAWSSGNTVYTATFDVADANVDVLIVATTVSGAKTAAGSPQPAHGGVAAFGIDTLNPQVTVDIAETALGAGSSVSVVTFTFTEAPLDFAAADVTTPGGSLGGLAPRSGSAGKVWDATYTAAAGFSGTGSVTVGTAWSDAAGNAGVGGSDIVAITAGGDGGIGTGGGGGGTGSPGVGFVGDVAGPEHGGPLTLRLSRTGSTATALTVHYTLLAGDQRPHDPDLPWNPWPQRIAASGEDIGPAADALPRTGQVVFAAGQSAASIEITPIDDTFAEWDEWLTARIDTASDAAGNAVPATWRHATVRIADDEAVSLAVQPAQGFEDAGPITVIVRRSGKLDAAFSVPYSVHPAGSAFDFSAAAASTADLAGGAFPTGTLHFAAGAETATVQITPLDDDLAEAPELLELRLGTPAPAAGTAADTVFLVAPPAPSRLLDDDVITLEFEDDLGLGGFFLGSEAAGEVRLWVLRQGLADAAVSVDYTIATGAPGQAAAADLDANQPLTGTLSFAAGEVRKPIVVALADDTLREGYEDFKVTLSNPQGSSAGLPLRLGMLNSAYASVADDDSAGVLDVIAYGWKSHTMLPGVVVAPVGAEQPAPAPTGGDGRTRISGLPEAGSVVDAYRDVPASEAASTQAAVNLQDAVAILKMIAGQPVNGAGRPTSPYQSHAADFDANGTVSLGDALAVLRHAVGQPDAMPPRWVFLDEADSSVPVQPIRQPGTPPVIHAQPVAGSSLGLVGVLRGDVDGSWEPPPGSGKLLDQRPGHFDDLVARFAIDPELPDISLAQWGLYAP